MAKNVNGMKNLSMEIEFVNPESPSRMLGTGSEFLTKKMYFESQQSIAPC